MRGFFIYTMLFSVLVNAPPQSSAANAALQFCESLCKQGKTPFRVFFVSFGVLNASKIGKQSNSWSKLIEKYHLDACCCVNSCVEHKLASSQGKSNTKMNESFKLAGLGQLVEAEVKSDRLITFGDRHDC